MFERESGVDISEVPGCHLLRQISSQGLVSHELTGYLSIFNQFISIFNESWSYYQKHLNQIILDRATL